MDNETHYVTYDPEQIWQQIIQAHTDAGGEILYPGDAREMLLRAVQAVVVQVLAGVDQANRMSTLRYAVGDYLDLYGEKRNCGRIEAEKAKCTVAITFRATGETGTIPAGAALTADGVMTYELTEDVAISGYAGVVNAIVQCQSTGTSGNGLYRGVQMQFLNTYSAVESVFTTADATGGREKEDDETYRERIRTHGLATVTTGPATQYESVAKSVSSVILDAHAVNGGAGVVNVYLILSTQEGAAALIQDVQNALNDRDIRPLTDSVTVSQATDISYTLNVEYTTSAGSNSASAIAQAAAEYQDWQDNTVGQAFNPDKLSAMLYQAGATRVVFGSGSEFDGGNVEYTEIGEDERCKGTITLTQQ